MYTYKIHIFLLMHIILLSNIINHVIHILNSLIKLLKNVCYTSNYISMRFIYIYISMNFNQF